MTQPMTNIQRADGFVSRAFGVETVVVPVRAGVANLEAIFTMNAVGSAIWSRIAGPVTVDELARAISREFEISEAAAVPDVVEFVDLLLSKGLVVQAEGTT
jgi:coenzyme PQQ synthesis protein D (PqqD)